MRNPVLPTLRLKAETVAAARMMLGRLSRLKGASRRYATTQPNPCWVALDPRASAARSGRKRGQTGRLPTSRAPQPPRARRQAGTVRWL